MYSVIYSSTARRNLRKFPQNVASRIVSSIEEIKEEPHHYIKKLKGFSKSPLYSLRVRTYRVIMGIEDDKLIIFVIEVGHRSIAYRKY